MMFARGLGGLVKCRNRQDKERHLQRCGRYGLARSFQDGRVTKRSTNIQSRACLFQSPSTQLSYFLMHVGQSPGIKV